MLPGRPPAYGASSRTLPGCLPPPPRSRGRKSEGAVAALRAEMERKAAELGISADELFRPAARQATAEQGTRARKLRSDIGAKPAVKYRGPNGETWSGRGRPPRWLTALEAEGRDRKEFAVEREPELGLP